MRWKHNLHHILFDAIMWDSLSFVIILTTGNHRWCEEKSIGRRIWGGKHLKFCSTEALLKRKQQERQRRFFNSAEQLFTVPACKSLQCPSSCCHCFPDGRKRNRKRKERDNRWWNEMQLWAVPIWAVTLWTSPSRWRDAEDLEGGCRCVCLSPLWSSRLKLWADGDFQRRFTVLTASQLTTKWHFLKITLIHSQITPKDPAHIRDLTGVCEDYQQSKTEEHGTQRTWSIHHIVVRGGEESSETVPRSTTTSLISADAQKPHLFTFRWQRPLGSIVFMTDAKEEVLVIGNNKANRIAVFPLCLFLLRWCRRSPNYDKVVILTQNHTKSIWSLNLNSLRPVEQHYHGRKKLKWAEPV